MYKKLYILDMSLLQLIIISHIIKQNGWSSIDAGDPQTVTRAKKWVIVKLSQVVSFWFQITREINEQIEEGSIITGQLNATCRNFHIPELHYPCRSIPSQNAEEQVR